MAIAMYIVGLVNNLALICAVFSSVDNRVDSTTLFYYNFKQTYSFSTS